MTNMRSVNAERTPRLCLIPTICLLLPIELVPMYGRRNLIPKDRSAVRDYAAAASKHARRSEAPGKRARGGERETRVSWVPPETWHEPVEHNSGQYKTLVQEAGNGYRHVVTPDEVRQRLAKLPPVMTRSLEIVQLSRMTRKKTTFPCYGMQWGRAIYLYPIENSLIEDFHRPPLPAEYSEARMYGGRWCQESESQWKLIWTEDSIRDFYLNNILIHELGHLLDHRNTSYRDRERFANSFAIEWGYRRRR